MDGWVKTYQDHSQWLSSLPVSILVLMDGWVKTPPVPQNLQGHRIVSILVLMDGWVKTDLKDKDSQITLSFNPCFNGWMGKDFH